MLVLTYCSEVRRWGMGLSQISRHLTRGSEVAKSPETSHINGCLIRRHTCHFCIAGALSIKLLVCSLDSLKPIPLTENQIS